ncbi:choline dehydrogenase 7, partial [Perkinsus olseni]
NICMQLRKCLAHPYLLDDVEDAHILANQPSNPDISSEELEMKSLVEMSGKMVFLDKLLPRLMETQQKVLVFSQMTRALDVIEDYLLWKGYKYERLDGNVSGAQRQEAIDRFNDTSLGTGDAAGPYKQQQPWIFLLSTRAGGVGINLTAANVVVIYDSDWNPQNDMQAQARCHRIGQKKEVKVYRLITRDSYEERMFDVASKKLGLEQALMSGVTKNSKLELSRKELQDLIKRGAYAAFEEDDANQQSTSDGFLAATIDDILSSERTKTVRYGTVVAGGQRSAFSKATFVANEADLERDEDEEKENAQKQEPVPQRINIDDADFWQKLAGEDFDRLVSQGMADPGTRRKQVVSYVQPSWADYKRMDEGAREGILTYAEQVAMNKIVKLGAPWTDKDTRHRLRDFLSSGAYGHWSAMRSYVMGSEDMPPQPSPSESSASSFSPDSDDDDDDYGGDTHQQQQQQQQQQQPYGGDEGLDEGQCEVLMLSFIGLLIKIIVLRAERSVNSEEEDDDDSDYIPDGASSTAGSTAEETLLDQLEWLFDLSILKAVGEDLKIIASDGLNGNERCWNRLWERLKLESRRTGDGDSEDAVVFDGIGALLTSKVSPVVAYLFPQWGRIVDGSMKSEE